MSQQSTSLLHQGKIAFNERRAAEACDLSYDTLRRYRRMGTGPRYCRIGGPNGPVRYRIADLDYWLENQSVASRAEEVSRNG